MKLQKEIKGKIKKNGTNAKAYSDIEISLSQKKLLGMGLDDNIKKLNFEDKAVKYLYLGQVNLERMDNYNSGLDKLQNVKVSMFMRVDNLNLAASELFFFEKTQNLWANMFANQNAKDDYDEKIKQLLDVGKVINGNLEIENDSDSICDRVYNVYNMIEKVAGNLDGYIMLSTLNKMRDNLYFVYDLGVLDNVFENRQARENCSKVFEKIQKEQKEDKKYLSLADYISVWEQKQILYKQKVKQYLALYRKEKENFNIKIEKQRRIEKNLKDKEL